MEPDTREKLLNAAETLFALKGSKGTTTRAVAAAAGVNELTLFRHFGSKEGLLDAMVERLADSAVVERILGGADSGDLEQDLLHIARSMSEALKVSAPLLRMLFAEAGFNPHYAAMGTAGPVVRLRLLARFFQERIDAGQVRPADPVVLAHAFAALFVARAVGRPLFDQFIQIPEDEIVRHFVQIFAHGVLDTKETADGSQ